MIVVIGEALIDLIESREQKGSYQAVVGGANANVAIALARRGSRQTFLARLSEDAFGATIRAKLVENGVDLQRAISATEPTSLAIASIGQSGGASYSFYVNGTADWGWTEAELPTAVELKEMDAKAIQFGCLTMAMPPGNQVIENWAKGFFESETMTISHDVNVRPALGFDSEQERERVERVNSFSHIIKASDDDISWLYNLEQGSSVDEIVYGWIGSSERVVFVTRGGDGVTIYRKTGANQVPSRKVKVQDTVGAGDTFCANMLGQLQDLDALGNNPFERLGNLTDETLIEIARVAGVAASMACEKTGAEAPNLDELTFVLSSLA
jgi:fructokinase